MSSSRSCASVCDVEKCADLKKFLQQRALVIKKTSKFVVFRTNFEHLPHFYMTSFQRKMKSGCPERRVKGGSKFEGPRAVGSFPRRIVIELSQIAVPTAVLPKG